VRSVMAALAAVAPFDENTHYPSFLEAADANQIECGLMAVECLLVYGLIFRELKSLPYIHRFVSAMGKARTDMISFIIVAAVFMLAFATAFHLAFGIDRNEFRTMGHSMMTLLRFLVGDVDLKPLLMLNAALAVGLVSIFTFVVYLQIVNMVVAILTRAYASEPSDETAAQELVATLRARALDAVVEGRRLAAEAAERTRNLSMLAESATGAAPPQRMREREARCAAAAGRRGSSVGTEAAAEVVPQFEIVNGQLRAVEGATVAMPGAAATGGGAAAEGSFSVLNPLLEAERAFNSISESTEQKAVRETRQLCDRLKLLYLRLSDEHAAFVEHVDTVRATIHALRDENYALVHAMQAKGIRFDPANPLKAPMAPASTSPNAGPRPAQRDKPAAGASRHGQSHHHAAAPRPGDLTAISGTAAAVASRRRAAKSHGKRRGGACS